MVGLSRPNPKSSWPANAGHPGGICEVAQAPASNERNKPGTSASRRPGLPSDRTVCGGKKRRDQFKNRRTPLVVPEKKQARQRRGEPGLLHCATSLGWLGEVLPASKSYNVRRWTFDPNASSRTKKCSPRFAGPFPARMNSLDVVASAGIPSNRRRRSFALRAHRWRLLRPQSHVDQYTLAPDFKAKLVAVRTEQSQRGRQGFFIARTVLEAIETRVAVQPGEEKLIFQVCPYVRRRWSHVPFRMIASIALQNIHRRTNGLI